MPDRDPPAIPAVAVGLVAVLACPILYALVALLARLLAR